MTVSPLVATREKTDAELMRGVQIGEPEAFTRLYDRHLIRALAVARAVCRDTGRAEDAVQEGFLLVWRNRASYRPELGSFAAWSSRIVRNCAIDAVRSDLARPPQVGGAHPEAADRASASLSDDVIAVHEGAALRTSLHALPATQAEVIVLAFFGELTHAEIAERLHLSEGTVKGRMRLGFEKLRRGASVRS